MEFILELFLEFIIQALGEALFELGLHSLSEPFRKPANPWFAAIGYAMFGSIFGGISIWLFPHHMVTANVWRLANLAATPVAVGFCMSWLGAWRSRLGQSLFRIDRFSYGYLFALCFGFVRFIWAV